MVISDISTKPEGTRWKNTATTQAVRMAPTAVSVPRDGVRSLNERKRTRLTIRYESASTTAASAHWPTSTQLPPSWWLSSTSDTSTEAAMGIGSPMKYLP